MTQAGIRAFQQEVGLPVTGEVSKELAGQLDLVVAAVKSEQESSGPSEQVTAISKYPESRRGLLERVSTGTGFVVDDEGRVLTNRHVIEGCEVVKVVHSSRSVTSDFIQPDTVLVAPLDRDHDSGAS